MHSRLKLMSSSFGHYHIMQSTKLRKALAGSDSPGHAKDDTASKCNLKIVLIAHELDEANWNTKIVDKPQVECVLALEKANYHLLQHFRK